MVTETKTLEIEGVPVLFKRSRKARLISVSVAPFYGVRVSVPYSSSYLQAERFVLSKMKWIRKHLEKMKNFESAVESGKKFDSFDDKEKTAARERLVKRLALLAKRYAFTYNRVSIRNQKTRWGSCSVKNNISLNIKLVRLPEELMDYVILHELVHTRIKDHGPLFWAEMDKLVGDGRRMRRRLKNYTGMLCM
ncbi:MAG: SprT family zinc-dependent metalloprotease [Dehalococcoidales bacterium]|nr:SprT family zinc-dependent metalloprotease [Dehalococcoidales bacterium]